MTAIVQLPTIAGPSKRRKLPWWLCPSSRELSLRSEIKMGYSTLGSRIAKNRYSPLLGAGEPIKISDKELAIIKDVLTKARDLERAIQIRSESLIMDYEQLRQNIRGNGETNCILCGHDPLLSDKKLQLIACDKCGKVACTTCYQRKRLQMGNFVGLCKLCYDYQELWCKTGAWMTNKLPEAVTSVEDMEVYKKVERRGTIEAGECLFTEVEVQLDQGYLTPEEDNESEEDLLKAKNVSSSYKNVKFTELEINGSDTRRNSAPIAVIEEMTDTSSKMSPLRRRGSNDDRRRALSSDNRVKLSEIRDKVKTKVSTLNTPSMLPHDASFDSQDSDFEPLKIHESIDEKETDMNILISTPSKEEAEPTLTVIEENENGKGSGSSSDTEKGLSSDNSDFEYGDIELPRSGFTRFSLNRAPVIRKVRSTDDEQGTTTDSEKDSRRGESMEESNQLSRDSSIELVDSNQPEGIRYRRPLSIQEQPTNDSDDDDSKTLNMDIPMTFEMTPPSLVVTSPSKDIEEPENSDELLGFSPVLSNTVSPEPSEGITSPKAVASPQPIENTVSSQLTDNTVSPLSNISSQSTDNTATSQTQPMSSQPTTEQPPPPPVESIQQLGSSSDVVPPPTVSDDPVSPPSSTPSSTNSSPRKSSRRLRVLTSSGEESQDTDDGYRWRRRFATRNSMGVGGSNKGKSTTPTSNEEKTTPTTGDSSSLSKREKARLAAKRVRESGNRRRGGGGVMSRSRKLPQDDDDDILEFVSPEPNQDLGGDKGEQLI